jgi:hypothetical protein
VESVHYLIINLPAHLTPSFQARQAHLCVYKASQI